ncbi:oligopeptide transporter [Grosmannia clavigera kw1407]|uniref:Oligopeptide transporter n=1 Tax=Grosmannia clavigera (strain kw1407 / UAMH 11150) TaxID=655863 RepID=F0XTD3_GROCL|nr:oligopeptide transporter [Grosmannia clavigera kw1407]EFW98904.1 oligopeptide transporter [Grosmannia clavigera kw1407]
MRTSTEQLAAAGGHHLTGRGLAVGLAVGLVICCSNMYFGLQTGFISTMSLPSSLLGFGIFKALARHLSYPFSPVENVLVQSVAGSMAIAPLGSGFVGVLPAMNYLLTPDEQGPINLSLIKTIFWSLGLCYFGVLFAVPLRRQVIIREKLKFPSGFSTAVLISVLHGRKSKITPGSLPADFASLAGEDVTALPAAPPIPASATISDSSPVTAAIDGQGPTSEHELRRRAEWQSNLRLLLICFLISGLFTLATYFFPIIRNLPIFGHTAAHTWLWTFNPSLAYIGQGVIMGPATTMHMLLGAVVGWAILSPLAKHRGWAPGPIDDWESGSKGWIVWISIAIMLADGIVSLTHVSVRSAIQYWPQTRSAIAKRLQYTVFAGILPRRRPTGYVAVSSSDEPTNSDSLSLPTSALPVAGLDHETDALVDEEPLPELDAPPEQQVGTKVVSIGLVLSILFCIACIRFTFGLIVPLYAIVISIMMALVLSIMGVRALGETDLNPVSGISKLTQLFFALIVPGSHKYSVLINLIAGAVSEAGALQAGELMQDLKTGHLIGAAPSAQFWGQVIGTSVGAVVSAFLYRLYTTAYEIPSDLFQIPTGFVWIFTARLVTGNGLPTMAAQWAVGAAVLFAILTLVRIHATNSRWHAYIPGGIAIAIGMYNVPSFTLARSVGGLLALYWRLSGRDETQAIVLSSGFILGEGFLSVVNLFLQSSGVPHL